MRTIQAAPVAPVFIASMRARSSGGAVLERFEVLALFLRTEEIQVMELAELYGVTLVDFARRFQDRLDNRETETRPSRRRRVG